MLLTTSDLIVRLNTNIFWSFISFTVFNWYVLTKMRKDLKRPKTTWNYLKRPTTTYNEQETTWNNLQRPTTSKKWPETTYKNLKRPATNRKHSGNDLQRARNDLKQPTTSKKQPIMTWTYLQWAKKDAKRQATSRFSDYLTIWGDWFSSLIRFPPNIWLQSFEHCLTENHGHRRAWNISIVSCVFFVGYNIYLFVYLFIYLFIYFVWVSCQEH